MRVRLLFLAFLVVFISQYAFARTEVGGNITEDTTWTKANSPYIVTSTLQVWDSVTLTIEPGVIVQVNPNIDIKIAGNIIAEGLNDLPILFTSSDPEKKWKGIKLLDSSGSSFKNCIFEKGDYILDLEGISTPLLQGCIFRDNDIVITDSWGYQSMNVTYCDFQNNYSVFSGIRTTDLSIFKYNNFIGNHNVFKYGFYFGTTEIQFNNFIDNDFCLRAPKECCGYGVVTAEYNWWGTTDTSVIDSLIYDKYDDVALQVVNYTPIQTSEIEGIGSSIIVSPNISVSPISHDFGDVTVGSTSTAQTFTISNIGYADLEIYTINLTGNDLSEFSIQNDSCSENTILAGSSCTVEVVFSPISQGAKSANLSIPSNDPNRPTLDVPLSGTGILQEPIPDIKANNSDGPITLYQNDTLTITVSLNNNGITDNADWWLAADTPFGLYFYTFSGWRSYEVPAYQHPLFYLPTYEVFSTSVSWLQEGTYTFYFGVDTVMDGNVTWDSAYYDMVEVTVTD